MAEEKKDPKTRIFSVDRGSMKRVLGVADLFAVGYGDLGSSIYYALGITTLYALGAAPIALIIAGIVFACTALTYAELSSVIHEAGGSASFSRKTFNDLISFIAGWGLLLDYIVTIAISSFSVAPYLGFFFPSLKHVAVQTIFSIVLVFFLLGLNIKGSKHSTRLSIVLTALTVITQVVIIIIGAILFIRIPELFQKMRIGIAGSSWSPTWTQFWHGVAMAMVAYTGIESMSQLSAEAKNPSKTVPKAILFAMVTLLIMYIGVSSVAISAITPGLLSTEYLEDPIAGIVQAFPFGGKLLGGWIGLLAAVILLVAANAGLMGASRLSFHMGEYFQIPRFFYRVHAKYKTPYVALTAFAILASGILIWCWGSLAFLADLYNFGAMLAFFAAHLALIIHRIKFPDEIRPFRVKFNFPFGKYRIPITAVIGALATATVWVLVVVTKPDGRYLGFCWLALGLIMYMFNRKKYKIPFSGQTEIEKIQIKEMEEHPPKSILVPTRGGTRTGTLLFAFQLAKMYNAKLKVLHVVDVSFFMPLNVPVLQNEAFSEEVLKRAQALAHEKGLSDQVELKMVRARSVHRTIMREIKEGEHDAIVLGASMEAKTGLGLLTERLLKTAPCAVYICRHYQKPTSGQYHLFFGNREDKKKKKKS